MKILILAFVFTSVSPLFGNAKLPISQKEWTGEKKNKLTDYCSTLMKKKFSQEEVDAYCSCFTEKISSLHNFDSADKNLPEVVIKTDLSECGKKAASARSASDAKWEKEVLELAQKATGKKYVIYTGRK